MRIVRRPSFLDDLTEVYSYLASRNPGVADRFLDEIEAVAELLDGFPEIGRVREELGTGIRSFRIRDFNHIVFYRYAGGSVILLRALHGARDIRPGIIRR